MTPLKSLVDETTNIKNEIIDCHSNLSSILTSKNVEVSEEDKMSDLIDKIRNIELGRKWASGDLGYINIQGTSKLNFKLPSLTFNPSLLFVILRCRGYNSANVNNVYISNTHNATIYNIGSISLDILEDKSIDISLTATNSSTACAITSYSDTIWYAFE